MPIHFRKALPSDSDLLFRWRNDPLTRAQSIQTAEVPLAQHEAWFSASLASPGRLIYLAEHAGKAVGMVRFDRQEGAWELSWNLAPEARGRGLGKEMVVSAPALLAENLVAKIKTENPASEAIARAAGFLPETTHEGVRTWRRPKNP